jgi:nucleoside 2-deoxyribosyltransferase
MKVYIAARFFDKEKVKEIYKRLRKDGHEISADWTWHINSKPYSDNPERCRDYSMEDLNGVFDCDIFILLTNEEAGAGTSTELGAAIALSATSKKPKIYVVGEDIGNNMFYFHPSVNIRKTMDEVYVELRKL